MLCWSPHLLWCSLYSWWRSQGLPPLQWTWYHGCTSEAISNGSGVRRQAATPWQSHAVESLAVWLSMSVLVRRVWMGWGSLIGGAGGFTGPAQGSWVGPLLDLEALHGGEISPVATTGREGCRIFSHPKNFGLLLSMANSGAQGVLGMSVQAGSLDSDYPPSQEGPLPGTLPHQKKERYHFTSSLHSFMLLASRHGSPPAGRSISSAPNAGGL